MKIINAVKRKLTPHREKGKQLTNSPSWVSFTQQPWYIDSVANSQQANDLLNGQPDGTYLVRPFITPYSQYILSAILSGDICKFIPHTSTCVSSSTDHYLISYDQEFHHETGASFFVLEVEPRRYFFRMEDLVGHCFTFPSLVTDNGDIPALARIVRPIRNQAR
ncbi:hypothetical protein PROFUN_08170 [Planoprotostelium fungivorum]|uniref:SH2 domain-containing protein n=1 Tax=Planoprotostelium fungivorum TaxID=1890364 RepID=A0A2P6N630_9EUKA|nr:hypothetical protein PROFUN_08170 [Planoprotostelium fungivorum]